MEIKYKKVCMKMISIAKIYIKNIKIILKIEQHSFNITIYEENRNKSKVT